MRPIKLFVVLLLLSFASSAQVASIVGPSIICPGSTGTYSDATSGGTWSISSTAVATIGISSGVATAVAVGTATITYTVGASYVTYPITVSALPAPITGTTSACVGACFPLSDATIGGTWSSSGPFIATISPSTGMLCGSSAGTTMITYTLSTGCFVTEAVTVQPIPAPIGGTTSVCVGGTTTLTDLTTGGYWTSAAPAVAMVGSATGTVSGMVLGSTTIYYSLPTTGCSVITTVSVISGVTTYTVTGGGGYCAGGTGVTVGLSGTQTGVSYQLYNGVTPVGSTVAGTGSAISFGMQTTAGTYTVAASSGSCTATMAGSAIITIDPLPTVFTLSSGSGSYCAGGTGVHLILSGSNTGINYQLYMGTTAIGSTVTGTGSSVDFGPFTTAGTYTAVGVNPTTTCVNTMGTASISVSPLPTSYAVTGGGSYCSGGSGVDVQLSASDPGISYQLYVGGTIVGSSITGIGGPVDFGIQTIAGTYTAVGTNTTTGCSNAMTGSVTVSITALPTLSSALTPPGICSGATFSYTPTSSTGGATFAWSRAAVTGISNPAATGTGDPAEALVNTTSSPVTVTYVYTISGGGCTNTENVSLNVDATPAITASASSPACGGTVTLTAGGGATYSWSPSTGLSCTACTSPATTPSGSVTYTVIGTDTYGCTGTATVTADGNTISGHITYTGVSTDVFTAWLIQFNPADSSIIALDSTTSCMDGGIPYFEFMDPAPGSYLVKAKLNGTIAGTSGYIPTYSSSTPYWYSAASTTHGSSADVANITMVYGTVPSGPGFISGYVYAGAGKGTSTDVPVQGMLIYLKDLSGHVVTYTYTDAAGAYFFNNIANGSYIIWPEDYKYYTTPSAVITLSPTGEIIGSVNFKKHTSYGTITPNTTSIMQVAANAIGVTCYPNPSTSIITFDLPTHRSGNAEVVVTDITGNQVYKETQILDSKQDKAQVDLSSVSNGMYFINFRSNDINFTGKIMIVK